MIFRVNMSTCNGPSFYLIKYIMAVQLNVFSTFMKNGNRSNGQNNFIIAVKNSWRQFGDAKVLRRVDNQIISQVMSAMVLYPASANQRAITCCFFTSKKQVRCSRKYNTLLQSVEKSDMKPSHYHNMLSNGQQIGMPNEYFEIQNL